MEGKTVILTVFLLSLVMAATASRRCPIDDAQICFDRCFNHFHTVRYCTLFCGCPRDDSDGDIPKGYEKDILQKTGSIKEEYCKLGCVSSGCSVITTLQNSGEEVVNGAIEKCTKACSAFCTKGSITALETSA